MREHIWELLKEIANSKAKDNGANVQLYISTIICMLKCILPDKNVLGEGVQHYLGKDEDDEYILIGNKHQRLLIHSNGIKELNLEVI